MALPKQLNTKESSKFFQRNNETYVRVGDDELFSSINTNITTIGTTATLIDIPTSSDFFLVHKVADAVIYIGDIDVTTSNGFPLEEDDVLTFSEMKTSDNEIYGIVSSGTVDIYSVGSVR